jgi:exopolyphosphatase/pppGpp-phosphohydrolase
VSRLVDSFRISIKDAKRQVEIIDVADEARLSHLGIVPDNNRYSTFLIDIGSGNTKGGFFPNNNTKDFKLFQVNWGTKSTANATEKKCGDDKSLVNYYRQLIKTAAEAENTGIIYAVNESGAFPKSDVVAFSGGIAWAVANLLHPEMMERSNVPVTYDQVAVFCEKIYADYSSYSDFYLVNNIKDRKLDLVAAGKEIKRIHQVFDQRSLMAGSRLLLKIMRQFESVNEKKEFYLIKNGQVGWVSAYVDQEINEPVAN